MGGKQLGFSDDELTTAKKQTKREKFLAEMEVVVPWQPPPAGLSSDQPSVPKAPRYWMGSTSPIHSIEQRCRS